LSDNLIKDVIYSYQSPYTTKVHNKMYRTLRCWPLKSLVTSCSWSIQNPTSYSSPTIAGYLDLDIQL